MSPCPPHQWAPCGMPGCRKRVCVKCNAGAHDHEKELRNQTAFAGIVRR